MRSLKVLMPLCLFSLLVIYQQTSPASKTELTVAAGLKKQSQEAYAALAIYGTYYKEKLRQNVKASVVSFDQQIQALASKMREAIREARDEFAKTVNDWRGQKEVLEVKLKEVKATCVAAWEATKKQISKRIEDLRALYDPANS